jgi:flagellar hook-associated protein 1 FlgK
MNLLVKDPRDIAAASPVRVTEATNANGLPTNAGGAGFSLQGVDSSFTPLTTGITFSYDVPVSTAAGGGNSGSGVFALQGVDNTFTPLSAGISFTYDAVGQQFNFAGDATGSFAYDPLVDSGSTFNVAGINFTVSGTPANGDNFSFSPAALQFTYSGDANGTLAYDPATDSGSSFNIAGIDFTISGNPWFGDSFVFSANSNGISDNRNALLLAGLQTRQTMEGGSTNFQGAYGQLVSDLGARTRSAQITAEAQAALLDQAQDSRDALSGVNLDEEAADLLRFQQAYQAIAQVISVADETFQTLLNAVGR